MIDLSYKNKLSIPYVTLYLLTLKFVEIYPILCLRVLFEGNWWLILSVGNAKIHFINNGWQLKTSFRLLLEHCTDTFRYLHYDLFDALSSIVTTGSAIILYYSSATIISLNKYCTYNFLAVFRILIVCLI